MGNTNCKTMFIAPTDDAEIISVVNNLKKNSSQGADSISPRVAHCITKYVAPQLSSIFNKSLSTGIFPDSLKIARVIPIHKADTKTSVGNYRPISILPFFSKI